MAVSRNPFLVIEISWKLFENVLFDLSAFVVSCCLVCCRRQTSHAYINFFYIHRKDFVMVYLSLHRYTIYKLKNATKWFVPCRFKNSVRWNILGCWLLFHILCHLHKLQIKEKNPFVNNSSFAAKNSTPFKLNEHRYRRYSRNKIFFSFISSPLIPFTLNLAMLE